MIEVQNVTKNFNGKTILNDDKLSAYENLDYYAQLYGISDGVERKRRIRELLEFVGLSDRRNDKVGEFSKGMRRKLALARAIAHEPEVLFPDEPSSSLDPEAQIMVNLRDKMGKPRVEIALSDSKDAEKALNILNSLDFVSDCERDVSRITAVIRDEKSSTILNVLMKNGIVVEEIKRITKSLEDVYLDIVQKGRGQKE